MSDDRCPEVDKGLLEYLNRNGYSFQNAVLAKFGELSSRANSPWRFEAMEHPVSVNGKDLHIDLLMQHHRGGPWLLGECKRVNPRMGRWCFVRHAAVNQNTGRDSVYLDRVSADGRSETVSCAAVAPVYHHGLELKISVKGDTDRPAGGAINDAVTQVLRGTNGFAEFLSGHGHILEDGGGQATILPVIFTTAELWVSDTHLADADLETGNLTKVDAARRVEWLYLEYHQTPGLRHNLRGGMAAPTSVTAALNMLYTRTIAVVGAVGIDSFARAWMHVNASKVEPVGS